MTAYSGAKPAIATLPSNVSVRETGVRTSPAEFNLTAAFYRQSVLQPHAAALYVAGARLCYAELAGLARRVSGWLACPAGGSAKIGILASRSIEAYAGILGALWSGAAYVPINPKTPEERLMHILRITQLDALVVDAAGANRLTPQVLEYAPPHILAGTVTPALSEAAKTAQVNVASFAQLPSGGPEQPVEVAPESMAYLLFTSGTTGVPKGVMVTAGCVRELIDFLQPRYEFHPNDRVSQAFELTFDLSVFDMFMTWSAGASLHVLPESQLMAPGKFIRDSRLTVWFCTPSTVAFMQRMRMLVPGAFPNLRCSLFCGEPLPLASAQAWQIAAPNSIVDNLYGPTEATVACLVQRFTDPPNVTASRGIIAIGEPFAGTHAAVVDANLNPVPMGEPGELLLGGGQLARGYFGDEKLTAARFPTIRGKRWYRTGDLVYQDAAHTFHHLGRIDNQVKVLGNRVELEEVEAHLREVLGTDMVAVVAWPVKDGSAAGLVAFFCGSAVSMDQAHEAMKKRVPTYMIPSQIREIERMPLGASGKTDRKALLKKLEEETIASPGQRLAESTSRSSRRLTPTRAWWRSARPAGASWRSWWRSPPSCGLIASRTGWHWPPPQA
jgi:amino acid adenylation domain-containing protein